MRTRHTGPAILSLAFLFLSITHTADAKYYASIIIDDIGTNLERGRQVIDIPLSLTLSILPGTDHARTLADLAVREEREVMLHLPMQSVAHRAASPGTLTMHMTKPAFMDQLRINIQSVPHVRGINNHMGSLMTQHPGYMSWLMDAISEEGGLYFIDSRTTERSVASRLADEKQIPNLERDVFLDPELDLATMEAQFDRFIRITKENGSAIAIAHPHPVSIRFIRDKLDVLERHGIRIVPVSELLSRRSEEHVSCTGSACAGL